MGIPSPVYTVLETLHKAGFEAYPVGGCARDSVLKLIPKDWDVATNAKPEEIQKLFTKSFYKNNFGTVTVLQDETEVEVTTYRIDNTYSDKRHPDSVQYTTNLQEDLARRDFTINAMALDASGAIYLDPFGGETDLKNKIVRAVGDPKQRFDEDALRLIRAVRFSAQLGFDIEEKTFNAIQSCSDSIRSVSQERIRDEFIKIVMSRQASRGVDLLRETGILQKIIPEIMEGYGVGQNKHHIYTVYEHNLRALQYSVDQNYNLETRLASLFHDVAKPAVKKGDGPNSTFYNHDLVGAKMTRKVMQRLKFPNEQIDRVSLLVRYHLFYYNVDEVTPSSVRRLIKNVGIENMDDLINLRFADRIGSGVPKAEPYKLRHFRYMVEKVSKDPISVKMLKINGLDIMKILQIQPSPKVGIVLNALFSEVLDDPLKNTEEYLSARALELNNYSMTDLSEMIKKADDAIKTIESDEKKQYRV